MNAAEWTVYLADAGKRVAELRERLAAGESEASAMAATGFVGRKGVEARVQQVRRNLGLEG